MWDAGLTLFLRGLSSAFSLQRSWLQRLRGLCCLWAGSWGQSLGLGVRPWRVPWICPGSRWQLWTPGSTVDSGWSCLPPWKHLLGEVPSQACPWAGTVCRGPGGGHQLPPHPLGLPADDPRWRPALACLSACGQLGFWKSIPITQGLLCSRTVLLGQRHVRKLKPVSERLRPGSWGSRADQEQSRPDQPRPVGGPKPWRSRLLTGLPPTQLPATRWLLPRACPSGPGPEDQEEAIPIPMGLRQGWHAAWRRPACLPLLMVPRGVTPQGGWRPWDATSVDGEGHVPIYLPSPREDRDRNPPHQIGVLRPDPEDQAFLELRNQDPVG